MKNGKPISMTYCTNEAKKYKQNFSNYVLQQVEEQGFDLVPDKMRHFYIDAIFYFPSIDLDCNNYFKCMLDAITDTQAVWIDDNITCERVQKILYDRNNPRIELEIYPVDYIGIFDNADQLDSFISNNCNTCRRNKANCSVLKKAMEGRVSEFIEDCCICKKYTKRKTTK